MRKLSEIRELPVMEILNGSVAGKVRDIVMNPDTKEVIMVMEEGVFFDYHILRKEDAMGIGHDFIMIKTGQAIQSSRENAELAKLLTEYYSIIGLMVITSKGNIVSHIKDISIDEDSWQIAEIILEDGKVYTKNQLLSVSSKYVFVQEDEDTVSEEEDTVQEEETEKEDEVSYLTGMTVMEDVTNADGTFTVTKGTVLTEEVVAQAKEQDMLARLVMNVE